MRGEEIDENIKQVQWNKRLVNGSRAADWLLAVSREQSGWEGGERGRRAASIGRRLKLEEVSSTQMIIDRLCGRAGRAALCLHTSACVQHVCVFVRRGVQLVLKTKYILPQSEATWVIVSKTETAHSAPDKCAVCVWVCV